MRRNEWTVGALAVLLVGALSGCGQASSPPSQQHTPTGASPASSSSPMAEVPVEPEPVTSGPCPYLDTGWVGRTNGQRVSKVRITDTEPPACFFYALNGKQQLMVNVYRGEAEAATALVNEAAPIEQSNPAEQPPGWTGGYMSTKDGAVYAVAKNGSAVVVTTNQKQSVKAREVVERTITSLGL